jgi:hypothetical protein
LRIRVLIGGILLTAVLLGGLLRRVAPNQSLLEVSREDVHFPTVSGFNLNRQEFTFPQDLAAELNILFIPFLQQQQLVVNTWIPFAQDTEAAFPGVIYYELPTIDEMPSLSRMFVNEGMRAGIPDETARDRTVTLYIDTNEFMEATDILGKDDVHILLVNRSGDILWRTTGRFDETKGETLLEVIEANRGSNFSPQ